MKKFIVNMLITMFILGMLEFVVDARSAQPSNVLAAYHNKVLHISYDNDQHNVIVAFERNPISMYTPLTYADSLDSSLIKTYFLPRTKISDMRKHHSYDQVQESLQQFGINLNMQEVEGANYGLQMNFIMQPGSDYKVVKVVDSGKKVVRFDIVAKI